MLLSLGSGVQSAFHRYYPIEQQKNHGMKMGHYFSFPIYKQGNLRIERVTDWIRMQSWSSESYLLDSALFSSLPGFHLWFPTMVINFMCKFDWTKGHPNWILFLGVSVSVTLDEIRIWVDGLCKVNGPPWWWWALSNLFRVWIKQKGEKGRNLLLFLPVCLLKLRH